MVDAGACSGALQKNSLNRKKEMALRAALGASRRQIYGHVLAESLVLSCLGGLLGFLTAVWAIDPLLALSPAEIQGAQEIQIDFTVLRVRKQ